MPTRSRLVVLLFAVTVALLIGGCGQRTNLIPESNASALNQRLDTIRELLESGDCDRISAEIAAARRDAAELPDSVERRLTRRIRNGLERLQNKAPSECRASGETTAPEPTTTSQTPTPEPAPADPAPSDGPSTTPPTTTGGGGGGTDGGGGTGGDTGGGTGGTGGDTGGGGTGGGGDTGGGGTGGGDTGGGGTGGGDTGGGDTGGGAGPPPGGSGDTGSGGATP